jgi:hypothetical protein
VADLPLDRDEKFRLLNAVADAMSQPHQIDGALDYLGFRPGNRPSTADGGVTAWREVFRELDAGRVGDGYKALTEYFKLQYPDNEYFTRQSAVSRPQPTRVLAGAPAPRVPRAAKLEEPLRSRPIGNSPADVANVANVVVNAALDPPTAQSPYRVRFWVGPADDRSILQPPPQVSAGRAVTVVVDSTTELRAPPGHADDIKVMSPPGAELRPRWRAWFDIFPEHGGVAMTIALDVVSGREETSRLDVLVSSEGRTGSRTHSRGQVRVPCTGEKSEPPA